MKLKSCPFCSGKAKIIEHFFYNQSTVYGIRCERCLTESYQYFKSRERAIEAWNKRVGEKDNND